MKQSSKVSETVNESEMISSRCLVDQINIFRSGKAEFMHKNLLAIIRDEFKDEIKRKIVSESVEIRQLPQGGSSKYPYFNLTASQAKQIFVRLKVKPTKEFCEKYNMNVKYNIINKTRFEVSFGNILIPILKKLDIDVVQQYNVDGYRIDFYLPDLNIAIEYDEDQHFTKENQKKDAERQKYIESKINCKFIRVCSVCDDADNVGIVLREIFHKQINKNN